MSEFPPDLTPNTRNFFQRDFLDGIEYLIPRFYLDDEITVSGVRLSIESELINKQINFANEASIITSLSGGDGIFSSVSSFDGISQLFIKQNNLLGLTPFKFDKNLFSLDGKTIKNFRTSGEFSTELDSFIPKIRTNEAFLGNSDFSSMSNSERNSLFELLLKNLSWFYVINQSGSDYDGSGIVKNYLLNYTYKGLPLTDFEGIQALAEFMWRNPTDYSQYIPDEFLQGSGIQTSGTQQLDKYLTLVKVLYSNAYSNRSDSLVKDSFENFSNTGSILRGEESRGILYRLLKAFSYAFADALDESETIKTFYDIDTCPASLLPELSRLIGWKLYGFEPSRWRLQLRNAVDVYKRGGTRQSIQFAVNSVFSDDVFNVSSNIFELWESYIPNLIYYSLATESTLFKDFTTWTRDKSQSLGVNDFSNTNFDQNIRFAVDTILLRLSNLFPQNFKIGGANFSERGEDFIFRYRGRDFPIPPFEEIPYYTQNWVSEPLVVQIVEELVCFGVPLNFALAVGDYIRDNTIRAGDSIRQGNNWLMFTSSVNYPPNYDTVIRDISQSDPRLIRMWSGKSSHYKLIFEASSFDFTKDTLEIDSKNALLIASRIADDFAPAHAIRDTAALLNTSDDFEVSSRDTPILNFDRTDFADAYDYSISSIISKNKTDAKDFRGGASASFFRRNEVDNLLDPLMFSGSGISVNRNTHRRRDYSYSVDKNGLYTRDGFNMPVSWDSSTLEYSLEASTGLGFLPLGLIPSACAYAEVGSHLNPSGPYNKCETLNSSSVFFGVATSSTYPCRGLSSLDVGPKYGTSAADYFVDRGQADDYTILSWKVNYAKKVAEKQLEISGNPDLESELFFKDVRTSLANSALNDMEDTFVDLYRVEFGRLVQLYYRAYTNDFNKHTLRPDIYTKFGPNIFVHTFGSLLYNSDFSLSGEVVDTLPGIISRDFGSPSSITLDSSPYASATYTSFDTSVISSSTDIKVSSTDFRGDELINEKILSGIQILHTSSASLTNSFTIFDVPSVKASSVDDYAALNNFLVFKSFNGFPRARFKIDDPNKLDSSFLDSNFLLPEHEFNLDITGLGLKDDGSRYESQTLGVWIHTEREGDNFWSLDNRGNWVYLDARTVSRSEVINNYAFKFSTKSGDRDFDRTTSSGRFICADSLNTTSINFVIPSLNEEEYEKFTVNFNTNNKPICIPQEYYQTYGQVHRKTQKYVIEVFTVPNRNNVNKSLVISKFNLYDNTLNTWRKIRLVAEGSGGHRLRPTCSYLTYDLTKDEVRTVLNHYNILIGNSASRVALNSSGVNEEFGGHRADFRETLDMGLAGTTLGFLTQISVSGT